MLPDAAIAEACEALARGGLVACPTEAVFGLGCDPGNAGAVERLLQLKQRSPGKGFILIAANSDALSPWIAPLTDGMRDRVAPTWPGPVTWLLPAAADCPDYLTGGHDTLAVRVTAHPVAAELCRKWGGALVSTSANPGGAEPARDAHAVETAFGHAIDVLVDGPLGDLDRPTPIRDARTGETVRE